MRFLHTSDWHLGVSLNQIDCQPEQERFLKWLVDTLTEREIDVLVIAGDIFHYSNPSNAARKLYFEFLRDCTAIETLRSVVVVGGNHDSASGLEAPRELLQLFDMHVVGALAYDETQWADQCLVPITGASGEVELVVAAVPYVQEKHLGVRMGDGGQTELRAQYTAAFQKLYSDLAGEAEARWPGAQLIATGHMTVYENAKKDAQKGDFHSAIHRTQVRDAAQLAQEVADAQAPEYLRTVGTIEAMGPKIFDPRFRYIALGHIHRPFPVGARHIRYSGTPIATSVDERAPSRQVILVEFDAEDPANPLDIQPISVPCWREVFKLEGNRSELSEALRGLKAEADAPAAVFLTVLLEQSDIVGVSHLDHFQKILKENHPSGRVPIIAEITQRFATRAELQADGGEPMPTLAPIEELTMSDVFAALYQQKNGTDQPPPPRLLEKFSEVHQLFLDSDESTQGEQ
ncbi:metallophosphoesterase family protein [Bradymonas sediminis]|uniref:metallophosphoesterase family protein n=1 Tax=Bradymonas sediminis TaxID=1548548 RepID=UPI0010ED5D6C|nr:exonuclease subunit SbcD [Bradymonas sediminis]TDP72213.1 exodeoxyribonuclease I subunit D [Bradymonas sediminis]